MRKTKQKLLAGAMALAMTASLAAPALAEPVENDAFAAPEVGDSYGAFGYDRDYDGYNGYSGHNAFGGERYDDDYRNDRGDAGAALAIGLIGALAGALLNDGQGATGFGWNNALGWNNGYNQGYNQGYGWNNQWNGGYGSGYGAGYGSGYGSGYGHDDYASRRALETCERKAEQVNRRRGGHGFEWTEVYEIDRIGRDDYWVEARGVSQYNGPDYYVDIRCRVDNGRITRFDAHAS